MIVLPLAVGERAPDLLDRELAPEERADVVGGPHVGLGDHGPGTRADEPGGVVVDPLDRHRLGPLGQPGLAVAARVAQVAEDDDRVGRELEVLDRGLAEILVRAVITAGDRVEPEAVLGRRIERAAVRARPAVAVAEVDDDRRAPRAHAVRTTRSRWGSRPWSRRPRPPAPRRRPRSRGAGIPRSASPRGRRRAPPAGRALQQPPAHLRPRRPRRRPGARQPSRARCRSHVSDDAE